MTIHGEHNEDLTLHGLEPGEDNPLEHEPTYNPLRYCYPMIATIDGDEYQIAVKFQLQEHHETTPIDFIDPATGKPHTIDFFPKMPDIAIEPEWDGPNPHLESGYQIGENPYYLVPTVHRCKHITSGHLLTREAANKLLLPEILTTAILAYRDQVNEDPEAPAHLGELLDMWDPCNQAQHVEDDDWYDDEYEDEEDWI